MMRTIVAAIACAASTGVANAQDWPTRPVNLIVPYAAGGPVDTVARILAARLSEMLASR